MRSVARLMHHLGLAMFLGSVLTFAVASGVPRAGDLTALAIARGVISAGTYSITLPGLALLVLSGVMLAASSGGGVKQPWARVMQVAGCLIVINTAFVVLPAVRSATALARSSASVGTLADGYNRAYMTESVAGGVNILVALVAIVAGVWRFGAKGEQALR